jgi:hypothetical protein
MFRERGVPAYLRGPSRGLIAVAFLAFGCALAYLGIMQSWALVVVLCFGATITLLAFWRMEWAILGLVVMSNFDGFLKPLFAERFSLFFKDYFVLLALVRWVWGLLSGEERPSIRTLVAAPALIFAGYVFAELANPNALGLTASLAGVRAWLIWIPVFFITYDYLQSRDDLERLWQVATVVSVVAAIYGIVQYFTGFEHLYRLSREFEYYAKMAYASGEGHRVLRVFSTMVHPGAFGSAMGFMALVASGLAFSARSHAWRVASLVCVPVMGVALFLSGSRAGMVGTGLGLLVLIVLSKRPALLLVAGALLVGGFWQSTRLTETGLTSRVQTLSWGYVSGRSMQPLEYGLEIATEHPLGVGVSSSVGVARMQRETATPQDHTPRLFIENDLGRALAELGVGALLYVALLAAAGAGAIAAQLRLRAPGNATLAAALVGGAVSIAATLAVGSALYIAPGAIYFWLAIASVMRLPALEKRESEAAAASQPAAAA